MDTQFWIKVWSEGRTPFHQDQFNDKLVQYFPDFKPASGQRVLVPLCGKSKDLIWLLGLKLRVYGVELSDQAVQSFFLENSLSPIEKSADPNFSHYVHGNMVVSCGDFFKLGESGIYDFVYDRAALVALPAPMRKNYARVVTCALKKGGKYLLLAVEYDQKEMDGPPFSVGAEEIRELYGAQFDIQLLESEPPRQEGPRLSAVKGLRQTVYVLEKS